MNKPSRTTLVFGTLSIVATAFVAAIAVISYNDFTSTESALFSLFLTLISIVATWIAAHIYGERSKAEAIADMREMHENNLKMYANKAYEKVSNLSEEMNKLSRSLQDYMESDDDDDLNTTLKVRDERVANTIHIISTLKSMNDTSLSDWEGVMGEELIQKRAESDEREEERDEMLRELSEKVGALSDLKKIVSDAQPANQNAGDLADIMDEIHDIRHEISSLMLGIEPTRHYRTLNVVKKKSKVVKVCPSCGGDVTLPQTRKGRLRYKALNCPHCKIALVSIPSNGSDAVLELRVRRPVDISCPICRAAQTVELENIMGAHVKLSCCDCAAPIVASRKKEEVEVFLEGHNKSKIKPIGDDILNAVRARLPDQPWPTGIHIQVARELDLTNNQVSRAIATLIDRGDFHHQVNGIVYPKRA